MQTVQQSSTPRKPRGKPFQKGFDARRHQFTQEERELGYERALLSVDSRFPDARCPHNAGLSHCLLRHLRPDSYARIQQERQVQRRRAA